MLESTRNIFVSYVLAFGILAILIMPLGESVLPRLMTDTLVSNNAFAQTSNSTGNTTSSANSTNFLTYKDSNGRFTIDYPSDWNVTTAKNRFEPYDVKFTNPDSFSTITVRLFKIKFPGNDIEPIMSGSPDRIRFSIPNFELNQDVECQKYTINGNKACSFIYMQTPDYISDVKVGELNVSTLINGTTYNFVYGSTPDNFDSNLPIIDKMIQSFKISPK